MRYELAVLSSQSIKAAFVAYVETKSTNEFPIYGEAPEQLVSSRADGSAVISINDYMSKYVWSLSGAQTLKLLKSIITAFHALTLAERSRVSVNNIQRIFFNITNFAVLIYPESEVQKDVSDSGVGSDNSDSSHATTGLFTLCQFIISKKMPDMQSLSLPATSDVAKEVEINRYLRSIFSAESNTDAWVRYFCSLLVKFDDSGDAVRSRFEIDRTFMQYRFNQEEAAGESEVLQVIRQRSIKS